MVYKFGVVGYFMKDGCVFCKILKGEIPCYKVWEDDSVVVFLDIAPYVVGHVMVVPKKHYRWIWDMPEEEYLHFMKSVLKIVFGLKKAFGTDWVEEGVAGVDIGHAHLHLFPRVARDGVIGFPSSVMDPKPSDKEMEDIAEKIRNAIED